VISGGYKTKYGLAGQLPSRATVERILAEEAKRARLKVDAILAPGKPCARVLRAKRAAIRRIVAETGCSARGLAKVWGLCPETVREAMGPTPPPQRIHAGNRPAADLAVRRGSGAQDRRRDGRGHECRSVGLEAHLDRRA
jgi:hypothetical protein